MSSEIMYLPTIKLCKKDLFLYCITPNFIFLLRHKYANSSHTIHAKSQIQSICTLCFLTWSNAFWKDFSANFFQAYIIVRLQSYLHMKSCSLSDDTEAIIPFLFSSLIQQNITFDNYVTFIMKAQYKSQIIYAFNTDTLNQTVHLPNSNHYTDVTSRNLRQLSKLTKFFRRVSVDFSHSSLQ
jgi:hypothetical protein